MGIVIHVTHCDTPYLIILYAACVAVVPAVAVLPATMRTERGENRVILWFHEREVLVVCADITVEKRLRSADNVPKQARGR